MVVSRSIDDLVFIIEPGSVHVYETITHQDLADLSFVQFAAFPNPTGTLINAVAAYLLHQGVDPVNTASIGAPTRLFQYVRFAQAGIPVPPTRYLPPQLLEDSYDILAEQLGLPFVLTALRGTASQPHLLVTGEAAFTAQLRSTDPERAMFLAQEFIPATETYNLLVLGREVLIVVRYRLNSDAAFRLTRKTKSR